MNTILNYAHTLGEAVARHSCHVAGLDAEVGVIHSDSRQRDLRALDVLEVLRPTIDPTVLRMLAARRFRRVDFVEESDGRCRLTESVTHPLAASMHAWTAALAPTVDAVAHELAGASAGKVRRRTPLTRASYIAVNRRPTSTRTVEAPVEPRVPNTCNHCGTGLPDYRAKLCGD